MPIAVDELGVTVVRNDGFATHRDDFAGWARDRGSKRLLLEDFYRWQRIRHGVLVEPDGEPTGGRWNFDADNREAPPRGATTLGAPPPFHPTEDAIDASVREDLDRWTREGLVAPVGDDGTRWFAATRDEALAALDTFVRTRLPLFGPHEDAILGAVLRIIAGSGYLVSLTVKMAIIFSLSPINRTIERILLRRVVQARAPAASPSTEAS